MMQFGIKDEEFIRGHVPMTKAEVRAMILARAGLNPEDNILDIGAGTGSVTVEMALAACRGHVTAIERNPEAIALIKKNAEKFGCSNVTCMEGTAPEDIPADSAYDFIFVGGSGGRMRAILDEAMRHLRSNGRLMAVAVTPETVSEIMEWAGHHSVTMEGFQMQINRLKPAGRIHLMVPLSPVYIFTLERA
jgi:cobalt-precorrin-6B (C15)-methyltransferase